MADRRETQPSRQTVAMPLADHNSLYTVQTIPESVVAKLGLENLAEYNGVPGVYVVTATLAIPGKQTHLDRRQVEDVIDTGDSLILLPQGTPHRFDMDGANNIYSVRFIAGDKGQLARVEMRLNAETLNHARSFAYTVLMATLSWISFQNDVGIDVTAWHTYEERTGVLRVVFGAVGRRRALKDGFNLILDPTFRPPLSAYREGLNNSNVFFQVLCFYRVIEWVKARRTGRENEPRILPNERIPRNIEELGDRGPDEQEEFTKILGRDFQSVYHRYEATLRNAIAHLNPRKTSLEADNAEDYQKCLQAVPVIRYMSRRMLHNEMMRETSYENGGIIL